MGEEGKWERTEKRINGIFGYICENVKEQNLSLKKSGGELTPNIFTNQETITVWCLMYVNVARDAQSTDGA